MTSFRQLSAGEALWISAFMSCFVSLSLSLSSNDTIQVLRGAASLYTQGLHFTMHICSSKREREREKKGEQFQFNACCSSFASRRRSRLSGKLILIPPSPRRGAKSPSLPRRSSADPITGGASGGGASGGRGEEWRGEETAIW